MSQEHELPTEQTEEFWVDLPPLSGPQASGEANGTADTPIQRRGPALPVSGDPLSPYGPSFAGQVPEEGTAPPPEPPPGRRLPDGTRLTQPPSDADPQGSWTGLPRDPEETPVQDADDL